MQFTARPAHADTQPAMDVGLASPGPTIDLEKVICETPLMLEIVPAAELCSLLATSTSLRKAVQGFVRRIEINKSATEAEDFELLARNSWPCLTKLCILRQTTQLAWCSNMQDWHLLKHVDLTSTKLEAAGVKRLCSAALPNLSSLDLTSTCLDTAAIQQLLIADWPNLEILSLANNQIGSAEMQLLQNSKWPQLTCLNLAHNYINDTGVACLVDASWPKLTRLLLKRNHIHSVACLGRSNWHLLEELDLSFNGLQADGLQGMFHACWPLLCVLKLVHTRFQSTGIAALAGGRWSFLQELHMAHNTLGIDGMMRLSTILLPSLECIALDVRQSEFGMFTQCYACWPRPARLHLHCVGFLAQDVQALVSYQWPQLMSLHLTENYSLQIAQELAAAKWPLFQQLYLSYTVKSFSSASLLSVDPWPFLTSLELHLMFGVVDTEFMTDFINLGLSMLTTLSVAKVTHSHRFDTAFMLLLLQGRWPKLHTLLVLSVTEETLYDVYRELRSECFLQGEDSAKAFESLFKSVWPTLKLVRVRVI